MPEALGSIPGGSTFLSCSFAISEVFGHNGMIQRSIIRPGLIGLLTKIIGVPTIGLPAVIPLRFSMITLDRSRHFESRTFLNRRHYRDI